MDDQTVRLTIDDDLHRSRLTVFFRLLLAIPHLVWIFLWSIAAILAAIAGWFAALATARLPEALHRFLAAYVRYSTHLGAYLSIAANPYPGFTGEPGYPVDVVDPVARAPVPLEDRAPALPGAPGPDPRRRPRLAVRLGRRRCQQHERRGSGSGPGRRVTGIGGRLRLPRLVRGARARPDAARDPQPGLVRARLRGPGPRVRAPPYRAVSELGPRGARAGVGAAASSSPARARRRRPTLAADRLLPPPARDPPLLLARALEHRRLPGLDRELVRRAPHRPIGGAAPPFPGRLRPVLRARDRIRLPGREPVPRLRRDAGLSGRRRRRPARATEPARSRSSASSSRFRRSSSPPHSAERSSSPPSSAGSRRSSRAGCRLGSGTSARTPSATTPR